MWVWVAPLAAIFALHVLTTPTFHALVRPAYRWYSIEHGGVIVADEVRGRWASASPDERRQLAWAYFQLVSLDPRASGVFAEYRQRRRAVLAASVALGRRWQLWMDPLRRTRLRDSLVADLAENLWFRLRVFAWPGLLLNRWGRGRKPSMFQRGLPAPDPGWRRLTLELDRAGVWSDRDRRPFDRDELEARQERLDERLDVIAEELKKLTDFAIEAATTEQPQSPARDRDDSPSPPSSSGGYSGGTGGSRSDHWGSWGDDRSFSWD